MSEHEVTEDEGRAQIERRRFVKAAAVTAWTVPFILTVAPSAHAAMSPIPCATENAICVPSAPIGTPDSCCDGLTCLQTQGMGDPAPITFTCQP